MPKTRKTPAKTVKSKTVRKPKSAVKKPMAIKKKTIEPVIPPEKPVKPVAKSEQKPPVVKETKKSIILSLLQQTEGTTIEEMMHKTGWQKHSVRGQMSILSKKLGLKIASEKHGQKRIYYIKEAKQEGDE